MTLTGWFGHKLYPVDGDGANPLPRGSIGGMVELRDATQADAHAIATVLVRSWRVAYRGLLPDDVLAGLSVPDREQFWSDTLTARPPDTGMVVATIAGAVVGFAATGPPLVPADRADPTLGDLYAPYLAGTAAWAASPVAGITGRTDRVEARGGASPVRSVTSQAVDLRQHVSTRDDGGKTVSLGRTALLK